jgi:hypothetical protein
MEKHAHAARANRVGPARQLNRARGDALSVEVRGPAGDDDDTEGQDEEVTD